MGTFAGGVIVEPSRSFLGSGEVAAVSGLLPHSQGVEVLFFSSLSLFLPLVLPSLGVFSLAGSFRCLFLLLFLGALYVAWVLFYVGLFSVRTFFFVHAQLTKKRSIQPPGW
jgi:hypothetical protein